MSVSRSRPSQLRVRRRTRPRIEDVGVALTASIKETRYDVPAMVVGVSPALVIAANTPDRP